MQVIELPSEEPKMIIEKKTLWANDNLKATCHVGTSFPASNITWFVNNKKVNIFLSYVNPVSKKKILFKNRSQKFHFKKFNIGHSRVRQHTQRSNYSPILQFFKTSIKIQHHSPTS